MAIRGKSINLFLMDGMPTGRIKVVLKGSHIETIDSESIPPGIKDIRQKASIDQNGILLEDIFFRSPSYAAAFVIGGHVNGLTEWKTEGGKTLKDIESNQISTFP